MKNIIKILTDKFGSKKKYTKVTKEEKKQMKEMFASGISIKKISLNMNMSTSVVSYWVTSHKKKKNGTKYKLSSYQRKKQRLKYKQNRVNIMRKNHEKNTPKYHNGCPVCNEVNVPIGMTLDNVIDEWVAKTRKINFQDILYAKKQKVEELKKKKNFVKGLAPTGKIDYLPPEIGIVEEAPAKDFLPDRPEPKTLSEELTQQPTIVEDKNDPIRFEKEPRFCAFCGSTITSCVCK